MLQLVKVTWAPLMRTPPPCKSSKDHGSFLGISSMGAMEEMSGKVEAHVISNVLIDVAASERDSTAQDGNTATLHIHVK